MYATLEEAVNTRIETSSRIQGIDTQLSQKQAEVYLGVTDEQYKEYLTWRAKAQAAKAHLVLKLQRTKVWITRRREAEAAARILNRGGEGALLAGLLKLVRELVSNGAEISQEEQQLIDDAGAYLERNI